MFDADEKFLQDMIVHHQAALDMSNAYLKVAPDKRQARVSDLAWNIIKAQTAEIAMMKDWLRQDGKPTSRKDMSGMKM